MKKYAAAALSAAALISLSACAETAEDDAMMDDETAMEDGTTVIEEGDTVMVDEADPATDGDSVSISEDGVTADINDGNTSVNADISEDPSLTIED